MRITLFFNTIEQLIEWGKQHEEVGKDNAVYCWRYCFVDGLIQKESNNMKRKKDSSQLIRKIVYRSS
ncbi:hypothetical protein CN900_13425 [Bacillus anthracis]|nr:hypothetical protein B2J90_10010 [Bacillus cereus]OJD57513.1 hypothetical protein BAU26_21215 [Bacillus sp. N35-10-4]PED55984.1 hypothetical protein CON50_07185 [Bacillus anthracis]KDB42032.1 hypothetical protein DH31_04505 [Bacillus cereus]KXY12707.1 hypothetical protein AT267_17580 [Bacillus cereus]